MKGQERNDMIRGLVKGLFVPMLILGSAFASGAAGRSAPADVSIAVSAADRLTASPDMAIGPDGSLNVIWVDKGENKPAPVQTGPRGPQAGGGGHTHKTYNDLYFARSTDGGRTFTTPLRINSKPGDLWGFATSRPRIAVGKSGVIHVFYHANRHDRTAPRQAVDACYTRSTDGGKTFEAPKTLNAQAAGLDDGELSEAHCFGTMTVAPNGDVHAFWIDTRHMKGEKDNGAVYGIASRDEGKTFEKEKLLFENEACPCCQLTAIVSPDNKVYVTLRSVLADGSRNATVARSDDGGKTFSPRVAVSDQKWMITACPLKQLNLATDAKGRLYAAWYAGEMSQPGVYFSVSDDKGKTFAKPQSLHPDAKLSDHAQISVANDGVVRIIWDAKIGDVKRIYTRTSTDRGKTLGPITEFPMDAGAADYPVVASVKNKTFAVWQLNGQIRVRALDEQIASK